MPEVRLSAKGQLTSPTAIVEKAQLAADATFEIAHVNWKDRSTLGRNEKLADIH